MNTIKCKKPELLVPANSLNALKIAVIYGADAVYIGGRFSLRNNKLKNFSFNDMYNGIKFAHLYNVKVYITINIYARNYDLNDIIKYLMQLKIIKPDALIISDPGIFIIAKKICPEIDFHISTQANNTNYMTCEFWSNLGVKRIVCARELSLEEIKEICYHVKNNIEIEIFIHGSMCIAYSGRCLLSNYFNNKDANYGLCTQPCRWEYVIMEKTRNKQYMPIFEDKYGTYILSSKDLCMINHIDDILSIGVDSIKIEGRMKTILYIATVTKIYKQAINDYFYNKKKYYKNIQLYMKQIIECSQRKFTTGFFYKKSNKIMQEYEYNNICKYTYLGYLEKKIDDKLYRITQKNKFSIGDKVKVMTPNKNDFSVKIEAIYDKQMKVCNSAKHPKQILYVKFSKNLDKYSILKKIK